MLAAVILCLGVTIYIANNAALSMLTLSNQYALATSEAQKSQLVAAGQVLLAQAEDFTPGAYARVLLYRSRLYPDGAGDAAQQAVR